MQKLVLWAAGLAAVFGVLGKETAFIGLAVVLVVGWFGAKLLWGGAKMGASATSRAVSRKIEEAKEERAYAKDQARDRARWEEELRRELKREEELARVRNTSQIEAYKAQVALMVEFKRQGTDIDKEVFAMREKLLSLEKQENSAMVQELLSTLNAL